MKVIDLQEAKANLEVYARECQTSPVVVMNDGKPCFELLPIRADDPGFLDVLLEHDPAFRNLVDSAAVSWNAVKYPRLSRCANGSTIRMIKSRPSDKTMIRLLGDGLRRKATNQNLPPAPRRAAIAVQVRVA